MKVLVMFSTYKILRLFICFSIARIVSVHSSNGVKQDTDTKCAELNAPGWTIDRLRNVSVDTWPRNCLLLHYTEDFLNKLAYISCSNKEDISCIRYYDNIIDYTSYGKLLLTMSRLSYLNIVKYYIEEKGIPIDKNDPEFLIDAASGGNLEVVKYLIYVQNVTKVAPTDTPNALHKATTKGNFEMVRFFVENLKYDVNAEDNYGTTPAHFAAASNISVLKYLIEEKGANLNAKTDKGETLLHYAAAAGQLAVVKYLAEEKNMSIDTKDLEENTPLHCAVSKGHLNVTKYIIDDRKLNVDSTELLRIPAEEGNSNIISYLVDEKKAKVDIKNSNGQNLLLQIAVNSSNFPLIRYLVFEKKIDINCTQDEITCTKILIATVREGDLEHVKYLVNKKGANINAGDESGNTASENAIDYGHLDVVKYLLVEKKANFHCSDNRFCRLLLELAARGRDVALSNFVPKEKKVDIIRDLTVMRYIDQNMYEFSIMVPRESILSNITEFLIKEKMVEIGKILQALTKGRVDVVGYLAIEKKIDFDCNANQNICGEILYEAVKRGYPTLVKYLLDEKKVECDWNVTLTTAISSGNLDVLKYLLNKKKGPSNDELLQKAAETGNINVINYLINEKKTDINGTELLRLYIAAVLKSKNGKFMLNTVRYLVDKRKADINNITDRNGVLLYAARHTNFDVIKYLIIEKKLNFSGVDYRTRNEVLGLAVRHDDLDFIEYLFDQGADININKLLETAAIRSKLNIIKYLVSEKNAKNNISRLLQLILQTSLLYSGIPWYVLGIIRYLVNETGVSMNSTEDLRQYMEYVDNSYDRYDPYTLRYFLDEMGANSNITEVLQKYVTSQDKYGASVHPNYDLGFIKYLVDQRKADTNGTDMYGNNLLSMVSADPYTSINIFKYLIEKKGANVRSKDSSVQTILHKAARKENLHLMKYLIEKQKMLPYIDDVDKDNKTPISMTRKDSLIRKYIAKKKHDAGIA